MQAARCYAVASSENFGRYIIASQELSEGTTVLFESALIYSPSDESTNSSTYDRNKDESMIFCLGCAIHFKNYPNGDKFDSCKLCGWPLCVKCDENSDVLNSHKKYECCSFRRKRVKFPPPHSWPVLYKSILILRLMMLVKHDNKNVSTFLFQLEHHSEIRSKKEHCQKTDKMIIENINYFLNETLDEELVRILIGIVNVNAFGTSKGNENEGTLRKTKSLFQEASLFVHSCSPNCTWNISIDPENKYVPQIKVLTCIPVKKGDILSIPYNTRHIFYGTLKRQILIESVAHFVCKCKRCTDETELGTFTSALRCFKCEKGFLLPKNVQDQESTWICNDCSALESVSKIVVFVTAVEECIDKIQNANLSRTKEFDMLQKLFDKHYGIMMHENHYTLQEISSRILELFVQESLRVATLDEIKMFLWHCNYLKKIADIILPGKNGYQDELKNYTSEGEFKMQQMIQNKK